MKEPSMKARQILLEALVLRLVTPAGSLDDYEDPDAGADSHGHCFPSEVAPLLRRQLRKIEQIDRLLRIALTLAEASPSPLQDRRSTKWARLLRVVAQRSGDGRNE
jgi:hypothetical protein